MALEPKIKMHLLFFFLFLSIIKNKLNIMIVFLYAETMRSKGCLTKVKTRELEMAPGNLELSGWKYCAASCRRLAGICNQSD